MSACKNSNACVPSSLPRWRYEETVGIPKAQQSEHCTLPLNHHVIENNSEIEITTNDNKTYQATVVGSDPSSDIAVLKINTDQKLPYVFFGNSDSTKIGEWVLAVGNPFNLNSTVTAGIISAKARDLNKGDGKNEWYIQTVQSNW